MANGVAEAGEEATTAAGAGAGANAGAGAAVGMKGSDGGDGGDGGDIGSFRGVTRGNGTVLARDILGDGCDSRFLKSLDEVAGIS